MAKEKANVEDTVKDIIDTGIDFRPQTVLAKSQTAHIIKPTNFDGQYIVNATGGITLALTTGNNALSHKLGRTPEGYIIVYKDANEDIYKGTTWNEYSCDLAATGSVNAKVIIY